MSILNTLGLLDGAAQITRAADAAQTVATPPARRVKMRMPFPGVGFVVPDGETLDATTVARMGGLDWVAEKRPLFSADGVNVTNTTGKVMVARSDNSEALGVVGTGYECLQNAEIVDIAQSVVNLGAATVVRAGMIDGGRRAMITLRMDDIEAAAGDTVATFLTFLNAHDGTGAALGIFHDLRLICENGMTRLIARGGGFSVRHTRNLRVRLERAAGAIRYAHAQRDARRAEIQRLVQTEVDTPTARAMFTSLLNTSDKSPLPVLDSPSAGAEFGRLLAGSANVARSADIDTVARELRPSDREWLDSLMVARDNPRNTIGGIGGSAWSVLNAYTDAIDHDRPMRNADHADVDARRLASNLIGPAAREKEIAYAVVNAYADARAN